MLVTVSWMFRRKFVYSYPRPLRFLSLVLILITATATNNIVDGHEQPQQQQQQQQQQQKLQQHDEELKFRTRDIIGAVVGTFCVTSLLTGVMSFVVVLRWKRKIRMRELDGTNHSGVSGEDGGGRGGAGRGGGGEERHADRRYKIFDLDEMSGAVISDVKSPAITSLAIVNDIIREGRQGRDDTKEGRGSQAGRGVVEGTEGERGKQPLERGDHVPQVSSPHLSTDSPPPPPPSTTSSNINTFSSPTTSPPITTLPNITPFYRTTPHNTSPHFTPSNTLPPVMISSTGEATCTQLNQDQDDSGEIVIVRFSGRDSMGLGFNIYGDKTSGIYVREVLPRGHAKDSGLVQKGDRLLSISVSLRHVTLEDALTLVSYASPYPLSLRLSHSPQAPVTDKRAAGDSQGNSDDLETESRDSPGNANSLPGLADTQTFRYIESSSAADRDGNRKTSGERREAGPGDDRDPGTGSRKHRNVPEQAARNAVRNHSRSRSLGDDIERKRSSSFADYPREVELEAMRMRARSGFDILQDINNDGSGGSGLVRGLLTGLVGTSDLTSGRDGLLRWSTARAADQSAVIRFTGDRADVHICGQHATRQLSASATPVATVTTVGALTAEGLETAAATTAATAATAGSVVNNDENDDVFDETASVKDFGHFPTQFCINDDDVDDDDEDIAGGQVVVGCNDVSFTGSDVALIMSEVIEGGGVTRENKTTPRRKAIETCEKSRNGNSDRKLFNRKLFTNSNRILLTSSARKLFKNKSSDQKLIKNVSKGPLREMDNLKKDLYEDAPQSFCVDTVRTLVCYWSANIPPPPNGPGFPHALPLTTHPSSSSPSLSTPYTAEGAPSGAAKRKRSLRDVVVKFFLPPPASSSASSLDVLPIVGTGSSRTKAVTSPINNLLRDWSVSKSSADWSMISRSHRELSILTASTKQDDLSNKPRDKELTRFNNAEKGKDQRCLKEDQYVDMERGGANNVTDNYIDMEGYVEETKEGVASREKSVTTQASDVERGVSSTVADMQDNCDISRNIENKNNNDVHDKYENISETIAKYKIQTSDVDTVKNKSNVADQPKATSSSVADQSKTFSFFNQQLRVQPNIVLHDADGTPGYRSNFSDSQNGQDKGHDVVKDACLGYHSYEEACDVITLKLVDLERTDSDNDEILKFAPTLLVPRHHVRDVTENMLMASNIDVDMRHRDVGMTNDTPLDAEMEIVADVSHVMQEVSNDEDAREKYLKFDAYVTCDVTSKVDVTPDLTCDANATNCVDGDSDADTMNDTCLTCDNTSMNLDTSITSCTNETCNETTGDENKMPGANARNDLARDKEGTCDTDVTLQSGRATQKGDGGDRLRQQSWKLDGDVDKYDEMITYFGSAVILHLQRNDDQQFTKPESHYIRDGTQNYLYNLPPSNVHQFVTDSVTAADNNTPAAGRSANYNQRSFSHPAPLLKPKVDYMQESSAGNRDEAYDGGCFSLSAQSCDNLVESICVQPRRQINRRTVDQDGGQVRPRSAESALRKTAYYQEYVLPQQRYNIGLQQQRQQLHVQQQLQQREEQWQQQQQQPIQQQQKRLLPQRQDYKDKEQQQHTQEQQKQQQQSQQQQQEQKQRQKQQQPKQQQQQQQQQEEEELLQQQKTIRRRPRFTSVEINIDDDDEHRTRTSTSSTNVLGLKLETPETHNNLSSPMQQAQSNISNQEQQTQCHSNTFNEIQQTHSNIYNKEQQQSNDQFLSSVQRNQIDLNLSSRAEEGMKNVEGQGKSGIKGCTWEDKDTGSNDFWNDLSRFALEPITGDYGVV